MKRETICKILYAMSILLAVGFCVFVIVDGVRYNSMLTSFPFWVFVLFHAVEFLLPAAIVLIAARIVQIKCRK